MRRIILALCIPCVAFSQKQAGSPRPASSERAFVERMVRKADSASLRLGFVSLSDVMDGPLATGRDPDLNAVSQYHEGMLRASSAITDARGDLEVMTPPADFAAFHKQFLSVLDAELSAVARLSDNGVYCRNDACRSGRFRGVMGILDADGQYDKARNRLAEFAQSRGIRIPKRVSGTTARLLESLKERPKSASGSDTMTDAIRRELGDLKLPKLSLPPAKP